jgi:hypothetical protein
MPRNQLIILAALVVFWFSVSTAAENAASQVANCKQPEGTAAVAFVDSPRSAPAIRPVRESDVARAHVPLFIRNDGSVPLTHWCVNADFSDYQDLPSMPEFEIRDVSRTTVLSPTTNVRADERCFNKQVEPGSVFGVDVLFVVPPDRLPLSGTITVAADGESREASKQPSSNAAAAVPCVVEAKEITRSLLLSAPSNETYSTWIVCGSAFVAFIFCCMAIAVFWRGLRLPMGGAQWDFTSSWATHVTVGGGILGIVFAASLLPDYPHFLTKQAYMTINLLFSVLIVLAPAVYNLTCSPSSPDANGSVSYKGIVLFFLGAAVVTMWAVIGQLLTIGFLFREFVVRSYVALPSIVVFFAVLTFVGLSLLTFCWRNIKAYAPPPPPKEEKDRLRSEAVEEGRGPEVVRKWNAF